MPSRFDINFDDMVRFERDPVGETVGREIEEQEAVGNRYSFDPENTRDRLASIFDSLRPQIESDPLNAEETERATDLSRRAGRLSPIAPSNEPISRRIEGNPFSIEIGPGLRNLSSAIVSRERSRRVQGDPEAVDTATRKRENFEARIAELAEQHANTDDPGEKRRIERRQRILGLRARRQERRQERYAGFEDELIGLSNRQAQAATASEAENERLGDRTEFVTEELARGLRDERDSEINLTEEEVIHSNRITLEKERQQGREALERLRQRADSGSGSSQARAEYTSAVNSYARINMERAKTFDAEIQHLRRVMFDQGITPDTGDEQVQAEYNRYEQRIQELNESKNDVLEETMRIYENSSVLAEGTRVKRKPTESQTEMFQEYAEMGATEQQLTTMATMMGVEFDAESLGLTRVEPEIPEGGLNADNYWQYLNFPSQQGLIEHVMGEYDLSEEEAVQAIEARAKEHAEELEAIDSQETELDEVDVP